MRSTGKRQKVLETGAVRVQPAPVKKKKDAASRSFRCVVVSLLITLVTLGLIFGFKIEMRGYGAYMYLLVTVGAIVYIVSTVVFVILSARKRHD